jgi:hypothetical protein
MGKMGVFLYNKSVKIDENGPLLIIFEGRKKTYF